MTNARHTPDFTLKETAGANGFNYWIKGVGNLYPDDKCTDEKLALIAAAPELLEALVALSSLQVKGHALIDRLQFSEEGRTLSAKVSAAIVKATGK